MTKPATPKHPAALYFNELAPLHGADERCVLYGHFYHPPDPDAPLTRTVIMAPQNKWGVVSDQDINDPPCGGDFIEEAGQRRLISVYASGDTYRYDGLQRTKLGRPPHVGFLSGLRRIGQSVYACGSQNTVYRMDASGWVDLAGPLRQHYSGPSDPTLNAIDGFAPNDLYAVGHAGAVFHFDGAAWHALDTPTNTALHQVVCHDDGFVYACGGAGTVLRGGTQGWKSLNTVEHTEDFWGMASLDGTVYLCTYRTLYKVIDGTLVEVPVSVNSAGSFYRLASNKAFLWATTGTGRVLRFDKAGWSEFVWPDSA